MRTAVTLSPESKRNRYRLSSETCQNRAEFVIVKRFETFSFGKIKDETMACSLARCWLFLRLKRDFGRDLNKQTSIKDDEG